MPTVGYFHTTYWAISDTTAPPVHLGRGGYPIWQSAVITPSLPFGPLGSWIDAMLAKVRWWIALVRGIRALHPNKRADVRAFVDRLRYGTPPSTPGVITKIVDRVIEKPVEVIRETVVEVPMVSALEQRVQALNAERRAVLQRVLTAVESEAYPKAREAVRQTAQTLGFNRPEAWKDLSRHMKASQGATENTYRHLKACSLLRAQMSSTLSNPDLNLTVELAYHGFASRVH